MILREPMSLLSELEARGVTAEDLQKAASARLFEKAAAAEGVNLDELGEDQVEEMYASFIHNHTSSAQGDLSKEATAMNDEIVDLFEKTAAAEGINLDEMDDTELVELYNHYVENVLPEQIGDKTASAEDEAYEKLAEAEILGRHMARAYMDELEKEAAVAQAPGRFEAMRQLKAQGLSTAEAKAKVDSMMNAGSSSAPSRKEQVRAAKKRAKQRRKNPRGTQAPQRSGMSSLAAKERALAKKSRAAKAQSAGADRVTETRQAAKDYLGGKYRAGRSAVGKRQVQLGRLLGGKSRKAARLRGGLAMGGAGLAATGALGYGAHRAMRKESSFDDFDELVAAFEDELLEKVAFDDDSEDLEDLALEAALENLYDAGIDLDELEF